MKLVIDSNRFIAGLLRDGASREIIFDSHFEFYSPDYLITEITKYREHLTKKAKMTNDQMDIMLNSLLDMVTLVPYDDFVNELDVAIGIMGDVDIKDAPFLAVGMAIGADGIWTEDKHFLKQDNLKVYTTCDILSILQ